MKKLLLISLLVFAVCLVGCGKKSEPTAPTPTKHANVTFVGDPELELLSPGWKATGKVINQGDGSALYTTVTIKILDENGNEKEQQNSKTSPQNIAPNATAEYTVTGNIQIEPEWLYGWSVKWDE